MPRCTRLRDEQGWVRKAKRFSLCVLGSKCLQRVQVAALGGLSLQKPGLALKNGVTSLGVLFAAMCMDEIA